MDADRFDTLSRAMGRLGPRRSVLKTLAALSAGALVTSRSLRPAAAIRCQTVADCPEPPCKSVRCKQGKCVFVRAPGCCTEDAQCGDGDPCTSDTCDLSINRCQHSPRPEEAPCGDGKVCRNGQCRVSCDRLQEPCTGDPHDFSNNSCCQVEDATFCAPSALGDARCCRFRGGNCKLNSDCCSFGTFTQQCRNGACCFMPGSECANDSECCGGDVCRKDNGPEFQGVCCRPEPLATTCDGKCGHVRNNCGRVVNCGCCPLRRVCATASDCCQQHGPTECKVIHGSSETGCCRASGEVCGRDTECCGEGVCRGSTGNARCCQALQQTCRRDGDCCGAAVCRGGRCA